VGRGGGLLVVTLEPIRAWRCHTTRKLTEPDVMSDLIATGRLPEPTQELPHPGRRCRLGAWTAFTSAAASALGACSIASVYPDALESS